MLHGSCLCSGVRYEIDGSVEDMTNCHCGMCRKAHGAAYATVVTAQGKDFRYTQGEELVETYKSSPELDRAFCRVCGSSLVVIEPKTGEVFVAAGTLDDDPGIGTQDAGFEITVLDNDGQVALQEEYAVPANSSKVLVMSNFAGYIFGPDEVELIPVEGTLVIETQSQKIRPTYLSWYQRSSAA